MKPKQIIILSVIFGILALGILLKSWVRSAGDNAGSALGGRVALAEFDPVRLERIRLGRGTQSAAVELAKENGIWKVKSLWDATADPVKVENLIQKLRSAQGELRGSGKKLLADFGIQDTEAFSIKLFGTGNVLLEDLRVGTKQAGEADYFIRKAASEDVYLVGVNIAELLGIYGASNETAPPGLFWADLSLFNLEPEKVTKITVYLLKGEEKTMIAGLERVIDPKDSLKSFWKFLRKDMTASLDSGKVQKFIAAMNSARAEKVVDPGGKGYGVEKPVWQLAVTEEGKKVLLNAGPVDEKGGLVYVKSSGDPAIFSLQASFFNDLNVDDTHFLKDVPPAAESQKSSPESLSSGMLEEQKQVASETAEAGLADGQGQAV
ncbi:MAG: DUF4340 domain-containing protein [Candidatus Omnitrophota bacterium]